MLQAERPSKPRTISRIAARWAVGTISRIAAQSHALRPVGPSATWLSRALHKIWICDHAELSPVCRARHFLLTCRRTSWVGANSTSTSAWVSNSGMACLESLPGHGHAMLPLHVSRSRFHASLTGRPNDVANSRSRHASVRCMALHHQVATQFRRATQIRGGIQAWTLRRPPTEPMPSPQCPCCMFRQDESAHPTELLVLRETNPLKQGLWLAEAQ